MLLLISCRTSSLVRIEVFEWCSDSRPEYETLVIDRSGDVRISNSLWIAAGRSGSGYLYGGRKTTISAEGSGHVFAVYRFLYWRMISRLCVDKRTKLEATGTNNPVAIIADAYTGAGFFEFEILQKLDSICVIGILLEAPFPPSGEPFR